MRAHVDHDLVLSVGRGLAGPPVPAALADITPDRLRYDGTAIVAASTIGRWAIDAAGRKRLPWAANAEWPVLDCAFDAPVERAPGGWRVPATGVTLAAAQAERTRRIAAGATITLPGRNPIPVQSRPRDRENLTGLAIRAQARIDAGDETAMRFRDADNALHTLSPHEMRELVARGAAWIEAVQSVVWAWADAGTVPADYTDDTHWPQRS